MGPFLVILILFLIKQKIGPRAKFKDKENKNTNHHIYNYTKLSRFIRLAIDIITSNPKTNKNKAVKFTTIPLSLSGQRFLPIYLSTYLSIYLVVLGVRLGNSPTPKTTYNYIAKLF